MDVALILGLRVICQFIVLKDNEPFSDLEKEYGATVGKREITVASMEKRLFNYLHSACFFFQMLMEH